MVNSDKTLKDQELNKTAADAAPPQSEKATTEPAKPTDPARLQKLAESRLRLHVTMAQAVLAMIASPRYKHFTIGELQQLVIEPLLRDRIAVASAEPRQGAAPSLNDGRVVGLAIWAKVSAEVDAKIREQIKAGVFPIRLKPQDWASGDIAWLLDVIAPSKKQATALLANMRQVVKEGSLLVHPIVRGLVDAEALKNATGESAKAEPAAERPTAH
jgi:hemolysin-activating ACP:hemolysin acyltransferase